MNFENGRFTHAVYVSSMKDIVEAIWMDETAEEDEGRYHQVAIETNLQDPVYVKLLETFSVDEISTMTDQKNKEDEENFKQFVKELATDYGMLYNPDAEANQGVNIDAIFNPPEGDEGADMLFDLKLKIFDLEQVANSEDEELQSELREADSPLKALYIAGKFLFE
jgi:hypothetical protein